MQIQNNTYKITLQEVIKGKTYKVSVKCNDTYNFSFINKTSKANIMVPGGIGTNTSHKEIIYTAQADGKLILVNSPNRSWTTAEVIVEEM